MLQRGYWVGSGKEKFFDLMMRLYLLSIVRQKPAKGLDFKYHPS